MKSSSGNLLVSGFRPGDLRSAYSGARQDEGRVVTATLYENEVAKLDS
jgi:hypothetical protein